jgi:hypothetical protein
MWHELWSIFGRLAFVYLVGVVVTFTLTRSRRDERVIAAFNALQLRQRRRVTEEDPLHTIFRIAAAAVWPLFWLARSAAQSVAAVADTVDNGGQGQAPPPV